MIEQKYHKTIKNLKAELLEKHVTIDHLNNQIDNLTSIDWH